VFYPLSTGGGQYHRNGGQYHRNIQPGKPSQNGLIERLNKTLRTECLNLEWFSNIAELNKQIQVWSYTYNQERPHQNLAYKTPDHYEVLNQKFYFSVVAA
jgi:putative transposase